MDIAVPGRFGNMAVVGVHVVVAFAAGMFARTLSLRERADRHYGKDVWHLRGRVLARRAGLSSANWTAKRRKDRHYRPIR